MNTPTPTAEPTPTPEPTATAVPTPTPIPAGPTVTVSGTITYDSVPHSANGGLNYDDMTAKPVRGATVQLLNSTNAVIGLSRTSDIGEYSFQVSEDTDIRVRVVSELVQSGAQSWDISVTDNTSGNAVYGMQGSLTSSGQMDSTRDLHADSGWNGAGYDSERVAAPFAILDGVYEALQLVLDADPDVSLPATELRWSVNNTAVSGDRTQGNIGTSFYDPAETNMYILGDDNNDTDEYDKSVIQHEWAHYLEDTISRSDSIGGSHTLGDAYDMRLAFSEGFANAFSGIASGQPHYSDSAGIGQELGFSFSLEENSVGNAGWFSENSIGKLVYDFADGENEGDDQLSLGFDTIYGAMTSADYVESTALTSIYLLVNEMKDITDDAADAIIDSMVESEGILGTGIYGEGETNDSSADISFALPVYNSLALGGTINVCGNNREAEYNGLDVRRHIRLMIPSSGSYRFTATTTLGTGERDPDIIVWRQGSFAGVLLSSVTNAETGILSLDAGEHIVEVYDGLNVDFASGGGSSCFDVSVTAI